MTQQEDTQPKKRVATIVVTYNAMYWLHKCLGSLTGSLYPTDIFVTDNHSSDGTVDAIKSDYPDVTLIQSERNLGFGGGNNWAITTAMTKGYDYYFLLNQDAWVESGTIGTLVEGAESDSRYGIISPMHLNGDGTALDRMFYAHLDPVSCPNLLSDLYLNQTKELYPVANVNAAAWLLRKEIIEKVGLFDPLFHMYGEDGNYTHRVNYYGYGTGLVTSSKIYHDRGNRPPRSVNGDLSFSAQRARMMVIILNPNQSLKEKLLLLFRKMMSDFVRNTSALRLRRAAQNLIILTCGFFLSLKYKNRYRSSLTTS